MVMASSPQIQPLVPDRMDLAAEWRTGTTGYELWTDPAEHDGYVLVIGPDHTTVAACLAEVDTDHPLIDWATDADASIEQAVREHLAASS